MGINLGVWSIDMTNYMPIQGGGIPDSLPPHAERNPDRNPDVCVHFKHIPTANRNRLSSLYAG